MAIGNHLNLRTLVALRGVVFMVSFIVFSTLSGLGTEPDTKVTLADANASERPLNFENDIVPILTKYGCNNSGCHGKAEGQNGFKLSVFGFDPQADHRAITREGRGRRIFPASPHHSLFLEKASGGLPHGGGVRITPDRPEYATLARWISLGSPLGSPNDPHIASIEISPKSARLAMGQTQSLKVLAKFSDGWQTDVTELSSFQSNNEGLANVDERGLVSAGQIPGDVAVMATYLGQVDVFRALVPSERVKSAKESPADFVEGNFIDGQINSKLRLLNLQPSQIADDASFMRRVYLDIIGTLPTSNEARQFLCDVSAGRRGDLVERLLKRAEYADYWGLKWSDVLRVNRLELGRKNAYSYYRWIHDSFASNKHLNQFADELLTAEGPIQEQPAAIFYKAVSDPKQMASTLSQAMLGVRIECAQCHHHPYDRWGQEDYYGMQAFFNEVAFKTTTQGEALVDTGTSKSVNPRTGLPVVAHALGEKVLSGATGESNSQGNIRRELSTWMTGKNNPYFARNMANRIWAQFMGRGLIEPVDDVRMTNPASHPELLDALADYLIQNDFDQQALIRLITSSATYQRSSEPNESNADDQQNYARFPLKRLDAEVLFDAVCQTTGVTEKFAGVPDGSRAIQLWDSHVPHYFLQLFGRPVRATACECERATEPTVSQVLHVLNSPEIQSKLSHEGGRLAKLGRLPDSQLTEELYLTFFARLPSPEEYKVAVEHFRKQSNRKVALEDLAWSMMNSLEFLFNH
ncbi:MAG: DUF1553 domain-containing protein [Pirellula sp.]